MAARDALAKACDRLAQAMDTDDAQPLALPATPLTHRRFNRRDEGTYGPFLPATSGQLMGHSTPLDGFYVCGDSTFPGIGVPAVASSGAQCANALLNVFEQLKLNGLIRMP
mgnify:CR=1 FL=1